MTRELFDAPSGRVLFTGPNGTGKTTMQEKLCPHLLDPSTPKNLSSGKNRGTTLESLMRYGTTHQRRIGYVWLSFRAPRSVGLETDTLHYGLRLDYARGTSVPVTRTGFVLPVVPGADRDDLCTMAAETFGAYVAGHGGVIFADLDAYVDDLAQRVFGCTAKRLKKIARRVKKVNDPGLLADLTPAQAEQELREVLPRVSDDVLTATQEALAAAETTRTRYERAQKTAALLQDLSAAWLHTSGAEVRDRVRAALAAIENLQAASSQIESEQAAVEAAAQSLAERQARVDYLAVSEAEAASRSAELDREAASSDLAGARTALRHQEATHQQATQLLRVSSTAAAAATSNVERTVRAVSETVRGVNATCQQVGDVAMIVPSPVSLERIMHAKMKVGEQYFGPLAQAIATVSTVTLTQSLSMLSTVKDRLLQRAQSAEMLVVAYAPVQAAHDDARAERRLCDAAVDTAAAAADRHRQACETALSSITKLSSSVTAWTQELQGSLRTPDFNLAGIAAQAQSWREGEDVSPAVREATDISDRVKTGAAAAARHLRLRAQHHRAESEKARKAAAHADAEARMWSSGKLAPLPGPPWHQASADEGSCFAMAVDWRADVLAAGPQRDTLEAAMGAAGLLSASLAPHGITADDGWMVQASGAPLAVSESLAAVLRAAPGHPLSATVEAVLQRIGLTATAGHQHDGRPELEIGADGTHRCGPLLARPPERVRPAPASHIGAEARHAAALRAAAAAQRERDRWESMKIRRARAASRLLQHACVMERLAQDFPHVLCQAVAHADSVRGEADVTAQLARDRAGAADRHAQAKEAQARDKLAAWRTQAAGYALPDTVEAMRQESESTTQRSALIERAVEKMRDLAPVLDTLEEATSGGSAAFAQVRDAHEAATASFLALNEARARLETCQQRSSMDEQVLTEAASDARVRLQQVRTDLGKARGELNEAVAEGARTQQALADASRRLEESTPQADHALEELRLCLSLEGFAEALGLPSEPDSAGDLLPWLAQVKDALSRLRSGPAGMDVCADALRLHLASGSSDEEWHLTHGHAPHRMPAHRLSLAGKHHSPHAAARLATEQRAREEHAYNKADETALEEFVLGQIPAAISAAWVDLNDWVDKVNEQMKLTKASSGVGVSIKVSLRKDLAPSLATIHRLTCTIGDAQRTPEQQRRIGQELLAIMRLGDNEPASSQVSGPTRADRLADAIDIRNWIKVQYLIDRPGSHREETWGQRGVTVSKGESRLIVLAPMLAALAAEYRDLPPTAARLCALDEVPGDVDDHGRDGIAAFLASLDLDLMCTSHNWDGSPGAWDGIDIFELEKASQDTIVAFPVRVYSPKLQHATGHLAHPTGGEE
ncbi:SbcC/MukB-like Walker B domain-containing protein [Streptomyces sp. NPDC001941]|uniref:SbcC/MukB-like Walker B domain-containing protein n=1 Tax=Streptomyces sp. NPDC001941 TaxID=3154659 RepID=UPI00332D7E1A